MKVISFYTEKGGTGKTTFNVILASYLAYTLKKKVLLLDCDSPGHHCYRIRQREADFLQKNENILHKKYLSDIKEAYPIHKIPASEISSLLGHLQTLKAQEEFDYIILDFPGSMTNKDVNTLIASKIIDLFVLPLEQDRQTIVSNINLAKSINACGMKSVLFWNRVLFNENKKEYDIYSNIIQEMGLNLLNTKIKFTVYFRRELSNDVSTVRSTLCYPEALFHKHNIQIDELLKQII